MKQKEIDLYMKFVADAAQLSYARRLKVGAALVKDQRIISWGYNGMPSGMDNNCEDEIVTTVRSPSGSGKAPYDLVELVTKPEVRHAEKNALNKLVNSTESSSGSVLFLTHAPCLNCATDIYQCGVTEVIYGDTYRSDEGIKYLTKHGVKCTKYEKISNS